MWGGWSVQTWSTARRFEMSFAAANGRKWLDETLFADITGTEDEIYGCKAPGGKSRHP